MHHTSVPFHVSHSYRNACIKRVSPFTYHTHTGMHASHECPLSRITLIQECMHQTSVPFHVSHSYRNACITLYNPDRCSVCSRWKVALANLSTNVESNMDINRCSVLTIFMFHRYQIALLWLRIIKSPEILHISYILSELKAATITRTSIDHLDPSLRTLAKQ